MNAKDNIYFILKFLEQTHFHVGVKSREYPGRMVVEHDLAAEFEVKFIVKPFNTFQDGGCLFFQVSFVIKPGNSG